MPHDIRMVHARDFIKTKSTGDMDLEASKKLIVELVSLNLPAGCDILIDIRDTVAKHTLANVHEAVSELVRFRETFMGRRIAVVGADEELFRRNTQFAEVCANDRGIALRGFTSFEDAMNWLTCESPLIPPDHS